MNWNKQSKQGMILLEAVIIIGILAVLFTLLMPAYAQSIERTKESVCEKNRKNLKTLYELDLLTEVNEPSEKGFEAFLIEQVEHPCPDGGTIQYKDGRVTCTAHKT